MKQRLHLKKLLAKQASPILYRLPLEEGEPLLLNDYLGKKVELLYDGVIHCIVCGRKTKKSFQQGFCYNCFRKSPEASECIIHPERCRGHEGEGRDPDWEQEHHVQEHAVYLAVSDVFKVGVTRATQIPTRWIDQGAHKARVIARTPNRYLAGQIEVALKSHYTDKTNWRKMLTHTLLEKPDWDSEIALLPERLPKTLHSYLSPKEKVWDLEYPVRAFPGKVRSLGLDKEPQITGTLEGIKGQYLILDEGRVFNIRKHTGYEVKINFF